MKKISVFSYSLFLCAVTFTGASRGAVPDTGQSICYDNETVIACPQPGQPYYGQDATYAVHPHAYTKLDAGGNQLDAAFPTWAMVRDEVTGLVWEHKNGAGDIGAQDYANPHDADNTYTWYDDNATTNGGNAGTEGADNDTKDFLAQLNTAAFGTFTDWRLPTKRELSELIDADFSSTMLDPDFFSGVKSDFYWSSTVWPVPSSAWVLTYLDGESGVSAKSYPNFALAVRGPKPGTAFTDNGNGTVSDTAAGLMWQQESVPNLNWKEALAYCEGLELAGFADWRLPDRNELLSLADYTRSNPAIQTAFFPDTSSLLYWTSTTQLPDPKYAFIVAFEYGSTYGALKSTRPYVRAVRTIGGTPATTTTTTAAATTTTVPVTTTAPATTTTAAPDTTTTVSPSTTTTVEPVTTTTTTAPAGPCPAAQVLGVSSPQLESLRAFRDGTLAQSALGRRLTALYYRNAGAVNAALDRSPWLRALARRALAAIAAAY